MMALRLGALALVAAAFSATASAQQDGASVFANACAACHNSAGQGTVGLAPALAGTLAPFAGSADGRRYVVQVLLSGLSGKIVSQGQVYVGAMPPQAALDDEQLAAVTTYLFKDLNGMPAAALGAADFAKARGEKTTHKELRELRARLLK